MNVEKLAKWELRATAALGNDTTKSTELSSVAGQLKGIGV